MYKLLTTAAVIMAVATPMSANEWTGAQKLISDLGAIYDGVGGKTTHFDPLQANAGALGSFIGTAKQGVTHITLNVAADHTISVGTKVGVTLEEIKTAQTNLINQVNYDLFVDGDEAQSESWTEYTGPISISNPGTVGLSAGEIVADGSTDYTAALSSGLVGKKVTKVAADVSAINDYLVKDGRTSLESEAVITGIANDATLNGIVGLDGLTFNTDIAGLNQSITTANDSNGGFFGNIDGASALLDGGTLSAFQISGYATDGSVNNGTKTYPTLLDWANDTNGVDN